MSYQRLTIKKFNRDKINCGICPRRGFCSDSVECLDVATKRLSELEDKIVSGELIEFPCIQEVRRLDDTIKYRVYVGFVNGMMMFYDYSVKEYAEIKLKEIRNDLSNFIKEKEE